MLMALRSAAIAQQPLQVLHNHVRSEVVGHQAALLSAMPSDQKLNVSIVLPLRNQTELADLLRRLYDPSSPDYRKFLSVSDFTDRFGPTAQDYQAVVAFAKANGLTVTQTFANRLVVPVSGTVAQIGSAFNVQMNVYQHPIEDRTFFSADREPSLALNVPVAHITGLNNYSVPHPMLSVLQGTAIANVTGSGPGGSYLGSDMRAAYYGGNTLDGNGQVVGILAFDGYNQSDVDLSFSNAGQSYRVPVNKVLLDGMSGYPTWTNASEQVLDIVQTIGMAPGLSEVRVYIGQNDADILSSMASENIAKQLSCSWSWRPDDPAVADVFFQEFAAQGQSFFTASGDYGAFDSTISPFFYPQEDAYVTSVGGTHLTTNGAGGSWSSETAWNSSGYGTGGGISPDGIAIPSWQSGLATTANGGSSTLRNVPDVAMEGDFDNYLCYSGWCYQGGAGTSFAAPRWAGFMALINQQAVEAGNAPNGGLGFINPAIYSIGGGTNYNNDLHDVSSGTNHTGTQSTWFSAVTGYDLVTGWGSANGQALIDDLAGPQVPGFWLLSSSSTVSVSQGGSSTTTIKVTDAGTFTDKVTLAITSTLPSGVTASWGTNPTADSSVLTLTATSSAVPTTATVTVQGTSGSLTATTSFTVAVHAPDFALSALPSSLGINQGATGTTTITVTPQYGFSGNVDLAVSGLPSGVTASWGTNPTSGTSVLTLTVSSSATAGTTTLTITGTSGSLSKTLSLPLSIHGPSFTVSTSPSVDIGQGTTGTAYVWVYPQYGFSGNVTLSASGLPSGVTASFSPNPTTGYSTLTLTASSSVPVGSSTVTITGTSGSLTASTTFTLGVHVPTFTLSGWGSVDVGQGSSGSSYVNINSQYGFNGNVTLSVSGLPTGVTALWNPNPTNSSSMLTLSASSKAAAGTYPLTITGTSGSQTATTTLTLVVHTPTFTLSGGGSLDIGQGTTNVRYIYVNPQYGFTGQVTLTASGLPSGVTASFGTNPTTGNSNLTLTATSSAAVGTYTVTITGTSGSQIVTTSLILGIHAPTFTLSNWGNVDIGQGTSTTASVWIYSQYGFSGNVSFSVSGLPSGVTAVFSPNPTTYSSTLTFTATGAAAVGTYPLTITGTSGSQTATTTFNLSVHVPTFTLSTSNSIDIGQGTSTSSYVNIWNQYGFTGGVTLSVSGLPSGVTASFAPNPTTGSSTMILTADSSAAVGTYTLTLTGTSGSQTATATITLGVHVPTFTLSGYNSLTVGQGSSTTAYVWVYDQYGFTGNVTLSASGLPSGVTATFSPNPTTGTSVMTLSATSAAVLGQSTVTITGTSGSQTASTTLTLTVATQSFTLYNYPNSLSLNEGGTGTSNIQIWGQNGFNGDVNLTATGLPGGVTASFSPDPATSSAVLTLSASDAAVPGTATVTITGTSGNLTASTTLSLTINAPGFNLAAAPSTISLPPGSSEKSTITVMPQNGFSGNVTLEAKDVPAGVTATFSPNPAVGGSSLLTLTAADNATAASGTVTITGTSGSITNSTAMTIAVRSAQTATSTTLAITSSDKAVASVDAGTAITLTASVNAGSAALTKGRVSFCEAIANTCEGGTIIGSAQLTSAGTASLKFIPGMGNHSYGAVFSGTVADASSSSDMSSLTVNGSASTSTTLVKSGDSGNYTLTATVTGQGPVSPSGAISFLDVSNDNAKLGSATLKRSSASLSWPRAQSSTTTLSPTSFAVGDFNGDGIPDIAFASSNSNQVSVMVGKGDGTFTAVAANLPTGSSPCCVAVGDFNGDGNLDLALANTNSNSVTILLGNGDATFTNSSLSPQTGNSPQAIVAGDFNRDGVLDLAVANTYSNSVTVLLGSGDGTFTASSLSPQTGNGPGLMAVGDFNADGILDLAVVSRWANTAMILLGNGDGTFAPTSSIATGSGAGSIVVGDFNADGKPDLVIANYYNNVISVLPGNGDGTFGTAENVQVTYSVQSMRSGDFNLDGIPDLAISNGFTTTATILLGNGDGTFTPGASPSIGNSPALLLAGDITGDGIPDLIVSSSFGNTFTVANAQLTQTATATATGISPLGQGTHNVEASYGGDSAFKSSVSTAVPLTAQAGPPVVTVTSSAASILASQGLTISVSVSGGSANPVPTGSVVLTIGSYSSSAMTLTNGTATFTVAAGTLAAGNQTLTVAYTPDSSAKTLYNEASGSASVAVTKALPSITLVPSSSSITTAQSLTVVATVGGGDGSPTPTGTLSLIGGGYSKQQTLTSGSATFTIAAGSLSPGTDSLSATYTPDGTSAEIYASASQSTSVVVSPVGLASPTITITPSATAITDQQSLTVAVAVAGTSGQAAPTGSIVLSSGSYSAQQTLSNGTASFTIGAGTLSSGSDTLSAAYSGDAAYANGSGTATVTVSPVVITAPAPPPVAPGSNATNTITLTAGSNYSGTMNLTCSLAASPTGAQSMPTCSLNPAILAISSKGSGTTTLTVKTTAASTASMHPLKIWGLGSGSVLAFVVMLGIPSFRRRWASMLVLMMVIIVGGAMGCGGGGGSNPSGGGTAHTTTPATTSGKYTFTVTGTDSADSKITTSTSVTVTVQ